MSAQTDVFRKLVRDFMSDRVVTVGPQVECAEVVTMIAEAGATSAVVVDRDQRAVGILTEQDVTRRLAFQARSDTRIETHMTSPVFSIRDDDFLYAAIAHMRRRGLRHMPVVDEGKRVVGTLDLSSALIASHPGTMDLIDKLTHEDTIKGLAEVKAAEVEVADALLADNVPAPEILALITDINNDIYRRAIGICRDAMEADGWGAPPLAFSVILMGSSGRGENYLYPDQDNGFVLEDYPDEDHERIDKYFVELAERMNTAMDEIGFPLCKGHVMARNPLWRKSVSQWKEQLQIWQKRRDVVTLRLSDIFFDYTSVYGDHGLASEVRGEITRLTQGNKSFLQDMYRDDADHSVALGWFNRFRVEKDDPDHKGELNLKYTGTLPLVEGLRLFALREGIEAGSTWARIDELADAGVLDDDVQDYLRDAFNDITFLLLRQQVKDRSAGRPTSNFVHPKSLTAREREELKIAFKSIQDFRTELSGAFAKEGF